MRASSEKANAQDLFRLRCPECGGAAFALAGDLLCPAEGRRIEGRGGLLPLLSERRREELRPFVEAYRRVRRDEGWGGSPAYYRNLPLRDGSGRHRAIWRIRARSYRLIARTLRSRYDGRSLRILELGAGNGWLSVRLAARGHFVLATDVSSDAEDGLGALARYAPPALAVDRLTAALAELEELPLDDAQFDVVIAAGSLHYASDLRRAVREAHRVLRPGGLFVVADSPTYDCPEAGRVMVARRRSWHEERYGIDEATDRTTGFLVRVAFTDLLVETGFHVEHRFFFEGTQRALSRVYRRMRHLGAPARFPVFLAERRS